METLYIARSAVGRAEILEEDALAVGGVSERHREAAKVERAGLKRAGVALGLLDHILWPDGKLLGLNNGEWLALVEQGVIGGAVGRRVLGEGDHACRKLGAVGDNGQPAGLLEPGVDATGARGGLGRRW